MDRQITCITIKALPAEDCTCIEYVGVVESDYLIPVTEVIRRIEKGRHRFYVLDYGTQSKAYVNVAQKGDLKYIRTESYDTPHDKLLNVGYCDVTNRPSYESGSMLLLGLLDLFRRK